MNTFKDLKHLIRRWNEKESRTLSKEEINAVDTAVVVDGQYGNEVCCTLKSGEQVCIPLVKDSNKAVGEVIDLTSVKLVIFEKQDGDGIIYRIRV